MSPREETHEPPWLEGLLKGLSDGGFGLESAAVADLLWLAPQLTPFPTLNQLDVVEKSQRAGSGDPSTTDVVGEADRLEDDRSGRPGELYLPRIGPGSGGSDLAGRTFSTPAAGPLPGIPALIRAFRPLMRRGPSRIDHVVDVPGTIRRITEEDLWEPVLRPAQERWLSLSLVVDVARSMDLWRPAARELGRVLGQMGSFARVHLWSWDTQNGDLALSPGLQGPIPGNTRARPSELGDPSGPHLVIVLTDCVADAWENGKAAARLADWSSDAHLVLAQILPEWLWNRTGLATALRVRVHSLWPFAPTSTLQVVPADPVVAMILRKRGAGKGETQVALPIVTFDPEPLARWAKAAAARQDSWVPGRSWQLSPPGKLGSTPSVKKQPPRADSTEDGEQLVPRFLAVATENARKLARLLAAAPVISLPVLRLVRTSMLPDARLVHEAEVLLSGLMDVVHSPPGADPEEVRYEFREEVRAQLLKSLPAPVARDVLEVLSDYVDQHLGQAGRFKTFLADPSATPGVIDPGENPIARVAAEILLRLGGDFARLVKVRKTSSREGGASRAIGKKRAVPPIHQVPRRVAWGLKRLGIPELWKQGLTGEGVLVGHPLTGVDADHPALKDAIAHFAEFDRQGKPVPGSKPHDTDQIGTHTAGTIAGRNTRSAGTIAGRSTQLTAFGVAPGAILASAIVIEGGGFERPGRGGNGLAPGSRG
jgi:subtilisin family serine protease